jgi:hypothetical protein
MVLSIAFCGRSNIKIDKTEVDQAEMKIAHSRESLTIQKDDEPIKVVESLDSPISLYGYARLMKILIR